MNTEQPAPAEKKKRTLPAALQAFKFQKGHKRATKPAVAPGATPAAAASPKATVTAANARAVTVKRHDSVLSWLGL
jgi:hypothetical protein